MKTEPAHFVCVVCGAKLPNLPRKTMLQKGASIEISEGHQIYFCLGKHSPEEIKAAINGVPKFQNASELPKKGET